MFGPDLSWRRADLTGVGGNCASYLALNEKTGALMACKEVAAEEGEVAAYRRVIGALR